MNVIWNLLHQLYTLLALVPFVAFFITWFIVYRMTGDKRRATHLSMDITTLFLIGSVGFISRNLFGSAFLLWMIILLFLVAAGLLGSMQTRMKGRVNLMKITRTLSRLGFLILTACYVLLLVVGIGTYMFQS
ncbi:DUF3397 domain-containing protein [Paenibacillus filicis]|uniref:DUF3397 domain-containing protein n=1 Tax=Paenibacillus filicis TaxID=669464 RepID=A0ABU9DPN2_9BACL